MDALVQWKKSSKVPQNEATFEKVFSDLKYVVLKHSNTIDDIIRKILISKRDLKNKRCLKTVIKRENSEHYKSSFTREALYKISSCSHHPYHLFHSYLL